MIKYIVVIGVALLLVVIGSSGKIPGVGRRIAVSEETRESAAAERAPNYSRKQAIALVEDYIRSDCEFASKYLPNLDRFEAAFIDHPFTDDHYERGEKEWTVGDPIGGGIWRLSEITGEIRMIRSTC